MIDIKKILAVFSFCVFAGLVRGETIFEDFASDPVGDGGWSVQGEGQSSFSYNSGGYLDAEMWRETRNTARYFYKLASVVDKGQEFWFEADLKIGSDTTCDWPLVLIGLFNSGYDNETSSLADYFPLIQFYNNRHELAFYDMKGKGRRFKSLNEQGKARMGTDIGLRVKVHYWLEGSDGYGRMDVYNIESGAMLNTTGVCKLLLGGEKFEADVFGIGNRHSGTAKDFFTHVMIDNLYFSTEGANERSVWPSFMLTESAKTVERISDQGRGMLKAGKIKEGVKSLEQEVARYLAWREVDVHDASGDEFLGSCFYLIAKGKEQLGVKGDELAKAYGEVIDNSGAGSARECGIGLRWLYENGKRDEFGVKLYGFLERQDFKFVPAGLFYGLDDGDEEYFRNLVSRVIDCGRDKFVMAELVGGSLKGNEGLHGEFLNYCKGRSDLWGYVCKSQIDKAALLAEEDKYDSAIKIYRQLEESSEAVNDKARFGFEVCRCYFEQGDYERTAVEVDGFVERYRDKCGEAVREAMLLKGRSFLHKGLYGRAGDEFFKFSVEWQGCDESAEASFLCGYCRMLDGDMAGAKKIFETVVKEYDGSVFAIKAGDCLEKVERLGAGSGKRE